jgi:hypothetical protein
VLTDSVSHSLALPPGPLACMTTQRAQHLSPRELQLSEKLYEHPLHCCPEEETDQRGEATPYRNPAQGPGPRTRKRSIVPVEGLDGVEGGVTGNSGPRWALQLGTGYSPAVSRTFHTWFPVLGRLFT